MEVGKSYSSLKVKLDLSRHCIQTELKRLLNRNLSQYFGKEASYSELEENIELVATALKTLDFSFLRSHFPDLAGESQKNIALFADSAGTFYISMDGQDISLTTLPDDEANLPSYTGQ
jgi:hypothetical protein